MGICIRKQPLVHKQSRVEKVISQTLGKRSLSKVKDIANIDMFAEKVEMSEEEISTFYTTLQVFKPLPRYTRHVSTAPSVDAIDESFETCHSSLLSTALKLKEVGSDDTSASWSTNSSNDGEEMVEMSASNLVFEEDGEGKTLLYHIHFISLPIVLQE